MSTCQNKQMGAGLKSGIDGNLHAVRAIWPHSTGWEYDCTYAFGKDDLPSSLPPSQLTVTQEESTTNEATPLNVTCTGVRRLPPAIRPHPRFEEVDPGMDPDTSSTRYRGNTGFGTALFDAKKCLWRDQPV